MRAIRLGVAFALTAGVALAAGSASAGTTAQRIDGDFALADDVAPAGTNTATVEIDGRDFGVDGQVSGTGTLGDQVQILYDTTLPTSGSANDKTGKVSQSKFTELTFSLVPGPTSGNVLLNLIVAPEKCKATASVDPANDKGKVSVNCTGENIFLNISAGQLASFVAAFLDRKDVVINVSQTGSTGSLKIKLDQKTTSK